MEESRSGYPNRVEISELGSTLLSCLPAQLAEMQHQEEENKENFTILTPFFRRRGQGIDFQEFAHHAQTTIQKQLTAILKGRTLENNQSDRRKQQLRHDNWVTQQRVLRQKLSDAHSRLEQAKLSEYDWQREKQVLQSQREDILGRWQAAHLTREKRLLSKLKKIMERKYPGRTASCANLTRPRRL